MRLHTDLGVGEEVEISKTHLSGNFCCWCAVGMCFKILILLYLCSYNTFCGYPPEVVKKMPKNDLAEEVTTII